MAVLPAAILKVGELNTTSKALRAFLLLSLRRSNKFGGSTPNAKTSAVRRLCWLCWSG
ncbi:MAG TPA: hypothetical protein VGM30_05165 [Puia sp.]|jgi:hypothetical protein